MDIFSPFLVVALLYPNCPVLTILSDLEFNATCFGA